MAQSKVELMEGKSVYLMGCHMAEQLVGALVTVKAVLMAEKMVPWGEMKVGKWV